MLFVTKCDKNKFDKIAQYWNDSCWKRLPPRNIKLYLTLPINSAVLVAPVSMAFAHAALIWFVKIILCPAWEETIWCWYDWLLFMISNFNIQGVFRRHRSYLFDVNMNFITLYNIIVVYFTNDCIPCFMCGYRGHHRGKVPVIWLIQMSRHDPNIFRVRLYVYFRKLSGAK